MEIKNEIITMFDIGIFFCLESSSIPATFNQFLEFQQFHKIPITEKITGWTTLQESRNMNEEDIRPRHIFAKFLELASIDTQAYFNECDREKINCPACNAPGKFSFNKNGFNYEMTEL